MKKRIAILIAASIYNQKGLFNAAHERVKHLTAICDYSIDLYLISTYKAGIARWLLRNPNIDRPRIYTKDDLTYNIIWIKNTILDYILVHKFRRQRIDAAVQFKQSIHLFKDYDLVIGHTSGSYVWLIHNTFNIPYTIIWHGTDIHTTPFLSSEYMKEAKLLIDNASHNFFVSKALLEKSNEITTKGKKSVSYNGRDSSFVCYSIDKKLNLKKSFSLQGKKVVAFVGNLIKIKNVGALPNIFANIYSKEKNIVFWIFGNGPFLNSLKNDMKELPTHFWGNVQHTQMVDFMNMMDVLVLPSLNEGLPLVTVEALSCGCHVVGSRVGGIPESIGVENTVCLDDANFEWKMAEKVLELMDSKPIIQLDNCFDWKKTALQENTIIHEILSE